MSSLHISINAEPVFNLLGIDITNSILLSWVVVAALSLFAITFSRKLSLKNPSRTQSLVEFMVEGLYGIVDSIAGSTKAKIFFPLVGTFFFYILVANWSGLIPGLSAIGLNKELAHGESSFVPLFRAPTADLNTTLALSLISMSMVQLYGVRFQGLAYFKKFFNFSSPINAFVGFLELISDFSRVVSFTFRLFGNVLAGEILLIVMGLIVPVLGPTPFMGLELFVGFIQALVFAMLSTVFINMATVKHDEEH